MGIGIEMLKLELMVQWYVLNSNAQGIEIEKLKLKILHFDIKIERYVLNFRAYKIR